MRDIHDLSLNLKISLDGDKAEGINKAVIKGEETKKQVKSTPLKPENSRFPELSTRKLMLVIAVDCDTVADVLDISKTIVKAYKDSQSTGIILSSSFSISEVNCHLEKAGLKSSDFDAFICNSGSEIHFPSPSSESSPYMVDTDYHSHIDYHWGGDSLRNNLVRWAASVNEKTKEENKEPIITEVESGSSHCYEFSVQDPELVS